MNHWISNKKNYFNLHSCPVSVTRNLSLFSRPFSCNNFYELIYFTTREWLLSVFWPDHIYRKGNVTEASWQCPFFYVEWKLRCQRSYDCKKCEWNFFEAFHKKLKQCKLQEPCLGAWLVCYPWRTLAFMVTQS